MMFGFLQQAYHFFCSLGFVLVYHEICCCLHGEMDAEQCRVALPEDFKGSLGVLLFRLWSLHVLGTKIRSSDACFGEFALGPEKHDRPLDVCFPIALFSPARMSCFSWGKLAGHGSEAWTYGYSGRKR